MRPVMVVARVGRAVVFGIVACGEIVERGIGRMGTEATLSSGRTKHGLVLVVV